MGRVELVDRSRRLVKRNLSEHLVAEGTLRLGFEIWDVHFEVGLLSELRKQFEEFRVKIRRILWAKFDSV